MGIVEEDYTGTAAGEDRVRPFADAVAKYPAVILPNHGALTSGPNIQVAMTRMFLLEGMCARKYFRGHGCAGHRAEADRYQDGACADGQSRDRRHAGNSAVWKDTLEKLQKSDPELFEYQPRTAQLKTASDFAA